MTERAFGKWQKKKKKKSSHHIPALFHIEGLCGPTIVPSALTHMMSEGLREPLSIPAGVIHMSPLLSMMDRLPPEVVVIPLR